MKRGVSPLLASVLLIGIVVMVAAVIFLWGSKVTKDLTEKSGDTASLQLSCNNVQIDVLSADQGQVKVENKGAYVDGITLVAKGPDGTGTVTYDDFIEPGSSRSYSFDGIPNVPISTMQKLAVIPALGKGIYRPCSDKKVEVNI